MTPSATSRIDAQIHRSLLDPAEGFGLAQSQAALQQALGPLDHFARLKPLGQITDLGLHCLDLGEPRPRHLYRWNEVSLAERLHDVGHGARLAGAFHEIPLAESGEHDHWSDPLARNLFGRADAIHLRHLDVQHNKIRSELSGKGDCRLTVTGLANHLVALLGEHLHQIKADEHLVLGYDNPSRRRVLSVAGPVGHRAHSSQACYGWRRPGRGGGMVYADGSNPSVRKDIGVRLPSPAPAVLVSVRVLHRSCARATHPPSQARAPARPSHVLAPYFKDSG